MNRFKGSEARVSIEIDGLQYSAISTTSVAYRSFLPPVEALPKRERDRLSGYLQICEENASEPHPVSPLFGITFANHFDLQVAASAYGVEKMPFRVFGTFVDSMLAELAGLSGHSMNRIAGELSAWGKGKTAEDWRRIWAGE